MQNKQNDTIVPKTASPKNYSVAVVATMSAGKSTLLNAMLGAKILPSKNEACTAKVFSIEDDDNASMFMARAIENDKVGKWQPATRQLLENLNDSSAEKIEICGNIKQIRNISSGHAVLLYDTPGPNNSRDLSHSQITKEIIRNSGFCSLICVLNATQLGTDDEFELLTFIRKEIEKQDTNSDVLFILNKIDNFSVSREDSVRESLKDCKKHLRDTIGFSNITILPVSSQLALLIRLLLNSTTEMTLAEVQEICPQKPSSNLRYLKSTLSEDDQEELVFLLRKIFRHKRTFASVIKFSPAMKRIFIRLNEKSKSVKDEHIKIMLLDQFYPLKDLKYALLLSGIPIIEKYLENKLKKAAKKQLEMQE